MAMVSLRQFDTPSKLHGNAMEMLAAKSTFSSLTGSKSYTFDGRGRVPVYSWNMAKRNWWFQPKLDTAHRADHVADEILRDYLQAHHLDASKEGQDMLRDLLVAVVEEFYAWVDDQEEKVTDLTNQIEEGNELAEANLKRSQGLLWKKPDPTPLAWTKVATGS